MALQEEFEKQGNWLFRFRGILPFIILIAGIFLYLHTKLNPDTYFLEGTSFEIYFEYKSPNFKIDPYLFFSVGILSK